MGKSSSALEPQGQFKVPYLLNPFVVVVAVMLGFWATLADLVPFWWNSDEYNFSLIIPFVIAHVIWADLEKLHTKTFTASWWAVPIALVAVVVYFAAIIADVNVAGYYALFLAYVAVVVAYGGFSGVRRFWFSLLLLGVAMPLPYLVIVFVTNELQLISTNIGVWFIRQMDLPVLAQGNVIDMGNFKMLVEEACSGLRYLFPLATNALILAYFFRVSAFWRVVLVLSSIPVTIIMNSFRIAFTGWLIKNFGPSSAEGFLHDFEGWVVFIAAFVILILTAWLISLAIRDGQSFLSRFDLEAGANNHELSLPRRKAWSFPKPVLTVIVMILLAGAAMPFMKADTSESAASLARKSFHNLPFFIDDRRMKMSAIDADVLRVLKADDTFLADYVAVNRPAVNLYLAYYQQQKDGAVIHSPKDCLPGGGWKFVETGSVELENIHGQVSRSVIQQGEQRLLVYYWIQQQGTAYANELVARGSLLYSSFVNLRSDGALVRVIVNLNGTTVAAADSEATAFIHKLSYELPTFIPN